MEEDDKGCPMMRMGVSGWMFLLVPAYPGSPGQKAVKRLFVCGCVLLMTKLICSPSGIHAGIVANEAETCEYRSPSQQDSQGCIPDHAFTRLSLCNARPAGEPQSSYLSLTSVHLKRDSLTWDNCFLVSSADRAGQVYSCNVNTHSTESPSDVWPGPKKTLKLRSTCMYRPTKNLDFINARLH